MDYNLAKGIPPGKVIYRELQKKKLSQREFAKSIAIHSQTLNAVIQNRRKLTVDMALKIEKGLDLPEGTLLMLQVYHQIEEYKDNHNFNSPYGNRKPNLRKILFWDTDFSKLDWVKQKDSIISRVMGMGNENEKKEIARFYKISPADLR